MPSKNQRGKNGEQNVFKMTHYISFYIPEGDKESREAIKTRLDWIGTGSSKIPKKGKSVCLEITEQGILCDRPIWWEDADPSATSISFSELHEIYIMRRNSKKLIIDLRSVKLNQKRLVFFEGKNADQIKALVSEVKSKVKAIEEEKSKAEKENEVKSPSGEISPSPVEALSQPTVISPSTQSQQEKVTDAAEKNVQPSLTPDGAENQMTYDQTGQPAVNLNMRQQVPPGTKTENKIIIPRNSGYLVTLTQSTGLPAYHETAVSPPPFKPVPTSALPEYARAPNSGTTTTLIKNGSTKPGTPVYELVPGLNQNAVFSHGPGNSIKIVFDNVPMMTRKSVISAVTHQPNWNPPKSLSQSAAIKVAPNNLSPWSAQPVAVSNRQTWQNVWYDQPEHIIIPRTNQRSESVPQVTVLDDGWGYPKYSLQGMAGRAPSLLRDGDRYCYTPNKSQDYGMQKPLQAVSYNVERSHPTIWIDRYKMEPDRPNLNASNARYLNGAPSCLPNELHILRATPCSPGMENNMQPGRRMPPNSVNFDSNAGGLPTNVPFTYQGGQPGKDYRSMNTMSYRPEYVQWEKNEQTSQSRSPMVGYH
ncbi:hypothetical protein CRM22_006629 [Opisthorchis felineus]|uniref:Uncharacterized protein n=1 Tax=Opisthorchis felineus TaxID=147828 RepID=A0A4S2LRG7_OPIFE|nr:hypothetical protein CRM22_006629 [Opisthorchis felineus]